jgi:pimeloyl-ACP methyl ester carboxylesterase
MSQRLLDIGGVGVSVYTAGDPDNPAVVLLHGGGLAGSTWAPVCEILSPQHFLVAPDLRGHGDSDWSTDGVYPLTEHSADVHALLDRLGLRKPHLVGMSLGGQTALHAVCHGLPVDSLTLVDIGPRTLPTAGRSVAQLNEVLAFATFEAALDHVAAFNPRRSRESLRASLTRRLRRQPDGTWAWKWDPRRLSTHHVRAREAAALWPLLGSIDAPVLIIRGADSDVLSERLAAELVDELARHGTPAGAITVPGAGHNVHSDQPARVAEILRQFFADPQALAVRGCSARS